MQQEPANRNAAARRAGRAGGIGAALAGSLVLFLLFALPPFPDQLAGRALVRVPVELPIVLLALALVPSASRRWMRLTLALMLGGLLLLKVANLAIAAIYGRPFNGFLHLELVPAGVELLDGAVGPLLTVVAFGAAIALVAAVGATLWAALGAVVGHAEGGRRRFAIGTSVVLLLGYGLLDAADARVEGEAVASAASSRFVAEQVGWHWRTFDDLGRFRAGMAADRPPPGPLLSALGKTDVLLVFVESYGRAALDNPRYADVTGPALRDFEAQLDKAGWTARSGWLASSTFGGLSWLAHGTLLSGLHIDGQGRYDALALSGRSLLIHDFERAGWSTVAVVPGITRAWPDAAFYGYDRVHAAPDLGYGGEPFGWISMPDQFTLSALRRLELEAVDRPPVMATVILISSHAPWTPVPNLVPWEAVGDGAVFGADERSGDSPEVVWADPDRVRAQYVRSIDYVLRTLAGYVAAHKDDDALIIIVGDHQPMPFVAGDTSRPDVPVHLIARDRDILAAIDDWGWADGMAPGAETPTWPMESFRRRFVETFTPAVHAAAPATE